MKGKRLYYIKEKILYQPSISSRENKRGREEE